MFPLVRAALSAGQKDGDGSSEEGQRVTAVILHQLIFIFSDLVLGCFIISAACFSVNAAVFSELF